MLLSEHHSRRVWLKSRVLSLAIPVASLIVGTHAIAICPRWAQDSIPAPPADRAQVYVANEANALEALPFETGTTPLKIDQVAGNDKRSYIEVKGSSAAKKVDNSLPRFYLFVPDEANVHPPFIVHLTEKKGARRVTAMAQKGLKGFAIDSEEIVKPHYRVLSHIGGALYMEISPRESLAPGEYAIIGADLQRIATFRIATTSNR